MCVFGCTLFSVSLIQIFFLNFAFPFYFPDQFQDDFFFSISKIFFFLTFLVFGDSFNPTFDICCIKGTCKHCSSKEQHAVFVVMPCAI